MMTDISLIHILAFGTMGTFSTVSLLRIASALDCGRMLRKIASQARRLDRAITVKGRAQRDMAMDEALRSIVNSRSSPLSRLFHELFDTYDKGDPADREARFQDEISRAVSPHLHNAGRLARAAGPLGLGITVLTLTVSLLGIQAGSGGGGGNLLQALPVSLITTAAACFNVVALNWTSSRLTQIAEEALTVGSIAYQNCSKLFLPASRPTGPAVSRQFTLVAGEI